MGGGSVGNVASTPAIQAKPQASESHSAPGSTKPSASDKNKSEAGKTASMNVGILLAISAAVATLTC